MTRKPIAAVAALLATVSAVGALPLTAHAQDWRNEQGNRQKTKNEWRNLAILGGAAAAYGALKGDKTVGIIGAVGTLYSLKRYEDDRKSQSQDARDRADWWGRSSFYQDGHRYERRIVEQNGERYYRYDRCDDDRYNNRYNDRNNRNSRYDNDRYDRDRRDRDHRDRRDHW